MNYRRVLTILIAVVLLWIVTVPPHPLVFLGPPQMVKTINPKMGIHTRLTDEVEEWKIKRTLEMVREMGAPWIVEYFPWGYYEPHTKGEFDWSHADIVVDHARVQGLTIIARIDLVPLWARPKGKPDHYLTEDRFADYADFVYAFVDHFRDRIKYVVIWNEPNLRLEWGERPPDPEAYTRLVKLAYARAKEADPNIVVLAGGLAPTLGDPAKQEALNDLEFLERMYAAGAKDYFDALAVHAYGKFPPDDPAAPDVINFARTELLRDIMVKHGDVAKKVMITEGGWNDHPRWTKAVRPSQRVEYTRRAYEKVLQEWDWVDAVALWAFRYPRPAHTFQDYFTFVTPDFVPKPIYRAVQEYARGSDELRIAN